MRSQFKLVRLTILLLFTVLLLGCTGEQHADKNTLQINIVNNTEYPGYFGVCKTQVQPEGRTMCSTPQPITFGYNRIFVPPYEQLYPFFTTLDEQPFFCTTEQNISGQLFLSPQELQNYTLVLASFNLDQNGNRLSVNCTLARSQN